VNICLHERHDTCAIPSYSDRKLRRSPGVFSNPFLFFALFLSRGSRRVGVGVSCCVGNTGFVYLPVPLITHSLPSGCQMERSHLFESTAAFSEVGAVFSPAELPCLGLVRSPHPTLANRHTQASPQQCFMLPYSHSATSGVVSVVIKDCRKYGSSSTLCGASQHCLPPGHIYWQSPWKVPRVARLLPVLHITL